jgi:hypothetical protein
MANEVFRPLSNVESFINMSLPVNGSSQGIISEAYLNESTAIQGYNWIMIGMFGSTWLTRYKTFGLPASVRSDISLFVDFSFTTDK